MMHLLLGFFSSDGWLVRVRAHDTCTCCSRSNRGSRKARYGLRFDNALGFRVSGFGFRIPGLGSQAQNPKPEINLSKVPVLGTPNPKSPNPKSQSQIPKPNQQ